MTLVKSPRFLSELDAIVGFIAEDSVQRALEFFDAVTSEIETILQNPLRYRKRQPQNDEKLRELIFKGYTIPFLIDDENDKIVVLGIFNQNAWDN